MSPLENDNPSKENPFTSRPVTVKEKNIITNFLPEGIQNTRSISGNMPNQEWYNLSVTRKSELTSLGIQQSYHISYMGTSQIITTFLVQNGIIEMSAYKLGPIDEDIRRRQRIEKITVEPEITFEQILDLMKHQI